MFIALRSLMLVLLISIGAFNVRGETLDLPKRLSPTPYISSQVPHVQVGVEPDPTISKELLRRVAKIPGVEIRDTVMSMWGALGFRLTKDATLARPDLGVREGEFAHMHPDGSLHAFLSPELAKRVVDSGWGAHHPYSKRWPKYKGFVMIFTPMSKSELKVVVQLVKASFKLVTTKP